jgi:thioredoxin-dependent peroxiredoxin
MSLKVAVGDSLPSVGLRATDGYLLNLRSFVTKQPALLLFFGGPTLAGAARRRGMKAIEALVSGHDRLRDAGIAVAGISADSEQQQTAFVAKHAVPFLLLSDERRSAVQVLGIETTSEGDNTNVAKPLALAIDRDGAIRAIFDPVDPETLVSRAIAALSEPLPASTDPAHPAA